MMKLFPRPGTYLSSEIERDTLLADIGMVAIWKGTTNGRSDIWQDRAAKDGV